MKKFAIVSAAFLLSSVFFLLSCSQVKTYDEGFEEGYRTGYSDARVAFEDDYARGYEDGYDAAADEHDYYVPGGYSYEILDIISEIRREAANYAARESENDIESAMVIVDCYLNNKPDDCGEWYSAEDFKEASMILYRFYEYYYNGYYASNTDPVDSLTQRINEIVKGN